MSDTARVARWRQRLRDAGKEPITIWLSHDEKLHLEDLARTRRCTTSDMVAQALAQFRPGSSEVTATVADTAQLRVLMEEAVLETTAVTALVTDIVTATLARDLPPLVQAAIQDLQLQPSPQPETFVTATNDNVADTALYETPRKAPPPLRARRSDALPPETLQAIATARRQHPDLTLKAFSQHLFTTGVYRAQGENGAAVPPSVGFLHRWLGEAKKAGVL
jgi:predicted transcriptional regulator